MAAGYKGYVFFSDYSWYDGNLYVENGVATNNENANREYVELMNKKIGAAIRKNDLTLRYNFFKTINESRNISLEE